MKKMGDIVYEAFMPVERGELQELLADCIMALSKDGAGDTDRMSNGLICDALFYALDKMANTLEKKNIVISVINDRMTPPE